MDPINAWGSQLDREHRVLPQNLPDPIRTQGIPGAKQNQTSSGVQGYKSQI